MEGVVTIRPIGEARVLHPGTFQPLDKEGARVALDTYWRRRIAEGAVEIVAAKKGAKNKAAKE
ncbi:MAG: DUF2635 domain-containing protein [bacterium]|nr:DUF2635 domain-containing protein [bacterium]